MPAAQRPVLTPAQLLEPSIAVGATGEAPDETMTARVRAQASDAGELTPRRVYELLDQAFMGKHPDRALQWLSDAGLLAVLIPELDATVGFSQEVGRRHKDVWEHTKQVVWQSVPRTEVRWAAVLHDIGKVPTRRFLPGGKVTFHGHAEEGVRMFRRGTLKRIEFPDAMRERVELLIRHHLRPGQYTPQWTDSAVRRFAKDMGPILRDLLDLSRADITSKRPGRRRHCLHMISELATRIRDLEAEDDKPKPLPPGLGNLLMEALELPPGKHLATLRSRLADLCEAGEIEGGREPDYYVHVVSTRGLMAGIEIQVPRRRSRPSEPS